MSTQQNSYQPPARIILGIDPGSLTTGYGILEAKGSKLRYLECGCIRTGGGPLPERLKVIFEGISGLFEQFAISEMAIENVFMASNPDSALKLGQARGAAISAVVSRSIPVAEYTANQVKSATVGKGHAGKEQVQHMVCAILNLKETPAVDASDALAVAICHANTSSTMLELTEQSQQSRYSQEVLKAIRGRRRGRFRL